MKNIIKSSLKNTLVAILLIGSVVVLVTALKGVTTNNYHMDFTQMYNIVKGGTLIEKSTLFQFIVNILLGVLPLFLFFAGITSSHSLFKKYNLSLNQLGLFVTYAGITASVTVMCLLFKLVFNENVLMRLSASALLGGNVYLLLMLLLGFEYSLKKGNSKPDRFSAKK